MRLNFADDEDWTGQFALWQANCDRSIKGKAGQRELRELEAALLALPEKRLIHGSLTDDSGGVCAIACYAKHKGIDISKHDPEDESDAVGIQAGMPRLVAWRVVALNDYDLQYRYDPTLRHSVQFTPEERYEHVLAWVQRKLGKTSLTEVRLT